MEGKLAAGESQTVKVVLDRNNMKEELNTVLTISDKNTQKNISITAQPYTLVVTQGLYTYYKFDGDFNDVTENAINGFENNSPSFLE